jgi:hypothetical protein
MAPFRYALSFVDADQAAAGRPVGHRRTDERKNSGAIRYGSARTAILAVARHPQQVDAA